jgi:uncharacterized protein (TIGR00369 family)
MELSFDDDNHAIITQPYNSNLDHGEGAIHGGAIATILDNAGFFTSALAINGMVTTSEMSFHLLRPAKKVKLIATGNVLKVGKRQVVAEMNCKDENGNLIAHGTGTFLFMASKEEILKKVGEHDKSR